MSEAQLGWLPVMCTIEKILKESENPVLQAFSIYQGTKGTAKEFPCCEILWDNEQNISLHNGGGNTGVWIDLFVMRGNDRPDSEAYAELYAAQLEVLELLGTFPRKLLADYGIAAKPDIKQIMSDGAEFTTTFGSRLFFTASRN